MLGLLVIYWIGKWFYKLAEKHNKNKWLFAILAPVIYYATSFISALIIIFLTVLISESESILETPDSLLGLMGVPFGVLTVWLIHRSLSKRWENEMNTSNPEVLDSESF